MRPLINDLPQAWRFFHEHLILLALMPVVGGFIGWFTKVIAIEMVFRPIEFKGIGPLGWQGQLPRRAAKFGSHAAEIVLGDVVDPRDLVDRLDPQRLVLELDGVIFDALDDLARDTIGDRWDQVSAPVRALVAARVHSRGPIIAANMLRQAKDNIDEMFDLTFIVTEKLISDKRLLNGFLRGPMMPALQFMKRFGLVFGVVVGAVQMLAFSFTESHLLIPVFGLVVGFGSDWIALQMLMGPVEPRRYLGVFGWHGKAYQMRDLMLPAMAAFAAEELLTPSVIIEAIIEGPLVDRLFGMLRIEVGLAIDAELGVMQHVVPAVIGSARYNAMRDAVVDAARARLPEAAARIEPYAAEAMDVENTITTVFSKMSNKHLESLLRPIFKDDEWLVVVLGGALGFAVGELQVYLLTLFGGL